MMRATHRLTVIVLVLAFTTACGTRPTAEIEAARAARETRHGARRPSMRPSR